MIDKDPNSFRSFDLFTSDIANITLDELYIRMAHQKQDLIIGCQWNDQRCSDDHFRTVLTDFGVCYSFDKQVQRYHQHLSDQ
ncbi:hypothetical protein LSH36_40g22039, partial [Paralvinella palmiformis]